VYAYIARQPIYDKNQNVAGYELLYRDAIEENAARFPDGDEATRGVLADAVTIFGIPNLTDGKPAYINFTKNLLMDDFALLADPRQVVVEVLGDVAVDDALAAKLQKLREVGYTLALEGYDGSARFDPILPLVHIARVDMRRISPEQLRDVSQKANGIKILAEKIENQEDLDRASRFGAQLFQGYFFAKPKRMSRHVPSLAAATYGRLLNETLQPVVDYDVCTQIIRSDVTLTYMFMRQIQTANYYRGRLIDDLKQGVVMMGEDELRRWVCLVMVRQHNITHSDELPRRAFLRGLFTQRLMERSSFQLDSRQGFLMGMFSLLDRVLGIELHLLLKDLNLDPEVKTALLGGSENPYSLFLQFAVVYEMASERLTLPDVGLKKDENVSKLYMECVAESDAAFQRIGGSS